MKAQKTSISVTELQKTIKMWKSRKITDSTVSKLLDLYLGLTAYMLVLNLGHPPLYRHFC